jgi:16S rRNA (adenine1518-N6/adenine1519-N6)-dimethyltransferase
MSKKETQDTLLLNQLAPKKRFGQNFLVHRNTAQAIAHCGGIQETDTIIEVGVGLGALTVPLAMRAKEVVGIEIDSGLVRYHQENKSLPENVTLLHDDVLKTNFAALAEKYGNRLKFMANLPYSISNPFIFKLVENSVYIDWVVVMLQKEMAERLMAKPSTKAYGIPTVLLGAHATVKKLMRLKPQEFHPRPKIDSLVIRIDFSSPATELGELPAYNAMLFHRVVRASFAQRRKTLENNIASGKFFNLLEKRKNKDAAIAAIIEAGLKPDTRAENLGIQDFIALTIAIEKHLETS